MATWTIHMLDRAIAQAVQGQSGTDGITSYGGGGISFDAVFDWQQILLDLDGADWLSVGMEAKEHRFSNK